MLSSPSHAERAAAGNLEPASLQISTIELFSTLPPIGEEIDEETQLEQEMTIERAKLGPHTSQSEDAILVEESEAPPAAMEFTPPLIVINQQTPASLQWRKGSPSMMTEDAVLQKPRGHGGPVGPEATNEEDEEEGAPLLPHPLRREER